MDNVTMKGVEYPLRLLIVCDSIVNFENFIAMPDVVHVKWNVEWSTMSMFPWRLIADHELLRIAPVLNTLYDWNAMI